MWGNTTTLWQKFSIQDANNVNMPWYQYSKHLWNQSGTYVSSLIVSFFPRDLIRCCHLGGRVNQVDSMNRTPLWYAARNGHKEVMVFLLQAGIRKFDVCLFLLLCKTMLLMSILKPTYNYIYCIQMNTPQSVSVQISHEICFGNMSLSLVIYQAVIHHSILLITNASLVVWLMVPFGILESSAYILF